MDSDLTGGLDARETAGEAEARLASPRTNAGTFMAAMNTGAADKRRADAEAAAKAQRRADLITLTAAALSYLGGKSGYGETSVYDLSEVPNEAVSIAEAALALIEERTK